MIQAGIVSKFGKSHPWSMATLSKVRPVAVALAITLLLVSASCQSVQFNLAQLDPAQLDSTRRIDQPRDEFAEVLASQLSRDSWRRNLEWTPASATSSRSMSRLDAKPADSSNTRRWSFGDPLSEPPIADRKQQTTNEARGDTSAKSSTQSEAAGAVASASKSDAAEDANAAADGADDGRDAGATKPNGRPTRAERWDGFWPLRITDVLDRLDPTDKTAAQHAGAREKGNTYLARLAQNDELSGWNAAIIWAQRDPAGAAATLPILERLVTEPPEFEVSEESVDDADSKSTSPTRNDNRNSSKRPFASRSKRRGRQRVSLAMQSAAAEAWCLVLGHSAPSDRSEDRSAALAPAGRILAKSDLPNQLRGELFRGVARWILPVLIPRFENALRRLDTVGSAPSEIRRAAIDACLIHALSNSPQRSSSVTNDAQSPTSDVESLSKRFEESDWPVTIWDCQSDPDAYVRRTFAQWLAVTKPPAALQLLQRQLSDIDSSVIDNAFSQLGTLGTSEARQELRKHAQRPEARVRELAVRGLAHWGASEIVPLANDSAFNVRQAVAVELGRVPNTEAAFAMRDLLTDSSTQVQAAAMQSTAVWPDELAIPLLLIGMSDSLRATRQACFANLRKRVSIREQFPIDGHPHQRAAAVTALATEYDLPTGFGRGSSIGLDSPVSTTSKLHVAEVKMQLSDLAQLSPDSAQYAVAVERLRVLDPNDVETVERFLKDAPANVAEVLYRDVLPRLNPQYTALRNLERTNVHARRQAAQKLAAIGAESTLRPNVVRQMRESLEKEQDQLVWRFAMSAVMPDFTSESAELALLAVNHNWADIRILGCQFIGRHRQPRTANWLLPLFHDTSKSVRLAAITAAGRCNNPIVIDGLPGEINQPPKNPNDSPSNRESAPALPAIALTGLRTLQTESDEQIRFAAVVAMSWLGDAQGMQELSRLSYHDDPKIRAEVVEQMAQTGRSRFVEQLIRIAWTESHHVVQRGILRGLNQLVTPQNRPSGLAAQTTYDDKVQLWIGWWQQRQRLALPAAASNGADGNDIQAAITSASAETAGDRFSPDRRHNSKTPPSNSDNAP